jgi:dihydroorotase
VHHLHFTANDYAGKGNLIKCNPAIKAPHNREAIWKALLDDRLDVIATDHAPHTWEEKNEPYEKAHAGLPLVQHSLLLMLHYVKQGKISLEKVVEKMSHAVARCYQVVDRGFYPRRLFCRPGTGGFEYFYYSYEAEYPVQMRLEPARRI